MRFLVFLCYSVQYLHVSLCSFAVLVPPSRPLLSTRDLSRAVSGSVKSLPQEENLSSAWLGRNFGAACPNNVTQAGRPMYPHYGVLVETDLQIEIHSKELLSIAYNLFFLQWLCVLSIQ